MTTKLPVNRSGSGSQKLAWSKLKEVFSGEWIELVSYDWSWDSARPRWGIVRHSAPDRKSLLKLIEKAEPTADSLILFVGGLSYLEHHQAAAAI